MKTIYFLILLLTIFFNGCTITDDRETLRYDNLAELLTDCKGYGIVVSTIYNDGAVNTSYKRTAIIRDVNGDCRQYLGREIPMNNGDTLVKKSYPIVIDCPSNIKVIDLPEEIGLIKVETSMKVNLIDNVLIIKFYQKDGKHGN